MALLNIMLIIILVLALWWPPQAASLITDGKLGRRARNLFRGHCSFPHRLAAADHQSCCLSWQASRRSAYRSHIACPGSPSRWPPVLITISSNDGLPGNTKRIGAW